MFLMFGWNQQTSDDEGLIADVGEAQSVRKKWPNAGQINSLSDLKGKGHELCSDGAPRR